MIDCKAAAELLAAVRAQRPLVQNITNYVAMDLSANALLAVGAAPAMVHAIEEADDFARLANALVLNVGTPSPPWAAAMKRAAEAAREGKKPVVLDPVGAGATRYRTELAVLLLESGVTAVRANASEILGLARASAARGVDAVDGVDDAVPIARSLAEHHHAVVAVTGPTDFATDGATEARVFGGAAVMAQVTAVGCALSAVTGAFLAARPSGVAPLDATTAALAVFAAAGARAAKDAPGPGSFRVRFLDELAGLDESALAEWARIER